jgi:hypothetical protein
MTQILDGGGRMKKWLLGALFVTALLFVHMPPAVAGTPAAAPAAGAPQTAVCADSAETRAEVPALFDLHEVIRPLWHDAWPNKNYGMMKEYLPKVREGVEKVRTAALPGILRDKKATWDAAVQKLVESLAAYEKAVANDDQQGLMDAVEATHSCFEGLIRITFPAMPELDEYHVVLYNIYHYSNPAKNLDALRGQTEELLSKAKALAAAPVPKRFATKEPEIKAGIAKLLTQTEALQKMVSKEKTYGDLVGVAVEKVHSQYQAVEGIFR